MPRIERINQQMKREISFILQRELGDPRFQFVTIISVDVSRDLRYAKVRFSVLGKPEQAKIAEAGLNHARGAIRKLVGQRISMRYTPELDFIYDQSLEYSASIDEALEGIRNELQKNNSDHQAA